MTFLAEFFRTCDKVHFTIIYWRSLIGVRLLAFAYWRSLIGVRLLAFAYWRSLIGASFSNMPVCPKCAGIGSKND